MNSRTSETIKKKKEENRIVLMSFCIFLIFSLFLFATFVFEAFIRHCFGVAEHSLCGNMDELVVGQCFGVVQISVNTLQQKSSVPLFLLFSPSFCPFLQSYYASLFLSIQPSFFTYFFPPFLSSFSFSLCPPLLPSIGSHFHNIFVPFRPTHT